MATHSSILASRIPWTEELGGLESTGRKESDTTERLHFHFPGIAIPQSGLLSQVSSLRLPSGHSGLVLTLSNASLPSLPAQPPLASGGCRCLRCFSAGSYPWARNLWVLVIYLFFLPIMLPSVVPRLATDSAVRVFPGVWKLLSF